MEKICNSGQTLFMPRLRQTIKLGTRTKKADLVMKRKYYKYRPQIQTDNFKREDILKIVLRPNIYKSVNHFIECAVIALLDKEDKNWRTEQ